ncbi:MAG: type II toxin-antitoxin system RelE/ParE family toxin [Eubacterium aggregans]|uniref:type II toxin-antitoxin system RelE/ParE family toxin n=1 Tax=Eubacterium aggregans TaxID=81409 RepID=UPI002B2089C7|nr:type II toxin-antitoxin system RelE/ParE family toxin [Eubacterium aggregans]MEA5073419.1 type II toxin-antitoxin system RelE/ParE family toxin [Eubacterium aggregans]
MDIQYHDKKIEKLCNDYKKSKKQLGECVAEKLHMALNFMANAENLNDIAQMPTYHLHPLIGDRGGHFAMDLGRRLGYRLILIPVDENNNKWTDFSQLDIIYKSTSTIILLEVTNHYE